MSKSKTTKGHSGANQMELWVNFSPILYYADAAALGGCEREKAFQDLVGRMKMKHHLTSKLTLMDMLSIGSENLLYEKPKTVKDLPWTFLRRLMALKNTARYTLIEEDKSVVAGNDDDDEDDGELNFSVTEKNKSTSIHPLDVLFVLLHCSDRILQQEMVTKMAMCQFAVPLLLPAGDGSHCTLMLWAIRDIVKRWRPQSLEDSKGFKEDSVVNIPMPIFSFVRLGSTKVSKSKILNHVLHSVQQHNNFFIHNNMEGGNIQKKISAGLVEMSWYFPAGSSDVFPEPVAMTNLRGDIERNCDQFRFLTRVSSAVFIFMESMSEREFTLLSTCSNTDTQYYFIVTPGPGKQVSTETQKTLQVLKKKLNFKKTNLIIYTSNDNEAAFVKDLQSRIVHLLKNDQKAIKLINLESKIPKLNIYVDEKIPECQTAMKLANEITEDIKNMTEYKQKTMMLQGKLWKELSNVEKELCRLTNQSGKDIQQYEEKLKQTRLSLYKEQNSHTLPNGVKLFIKALTNLSKEEKQYFLKWMKLKLDSLTRDHLLELQTGCRKICSDSSNYTNDPNQISHDSSVGIEHFLREMGLFYEAQCSMAKESSQRKFKNLPEIAAKLLLDGFPLELIEGDASNIPLQWVTNVLSELNRKTGEKCRMRVISVLGVQGTGKSTLLNTMFGLQFPVASGRCTRGAFMTLLNVKENFQKELGCEFIMVIDTEGLKAPELASLEGSYEHDNELATLVVGLSDITIVNMSMENATEMKDILQIVVHAILRMKEVGKKTNCQFVHQNVSDVSAYDKNMRDRKKLLEQLNEMTKVAAQMEKKSGIQTFNDVMDYDLEKDNWYIPALWLGVPPMAPVNSEYSEHVYELKKHLLYILKNMVKSPHEPLSIPEFISWIKSLWNAVKHENFIFSFRSSLVAEAYNKLTVQFSQWEWDFRKSVHDWLIKKEVAIKNMSVESLNKDPCSEFKHELDNLVLTGKHKIDKLLEDYFGKKTDNVHLIGRYRDDFTWSTESLGKELLRNTERKIEEVVSIQKGKLKVQEIHNKFQNLIEDKINNLLQSCQEKKQKLSEEELKKEFEEMWKQTLADLQTEKLQRLTVSKTMLQQLRNDMSNKGAAVNEALLHVTDLTDRAQHDFKIDANYYEGKWIQWVKHADGCNKKKSLGIIKYFAYFLIHKCDTYVTGKVHTAEDFDEAYCQELLHIINTELREQEKDFYFSVQFELDIKLHILARASREFQKMHDTFIAENDPKLFLERLKPYYLETCLGTFQNKDECQSKAEEFCKRCLKPAMMDHVFQQLGNIIVDDMVRDSDNKIFNSRTFFQGHLLKELLEKKSFEEYERYISSYEEYTRFWIQNHIEKKYADTKTLKTMQQTILVVVSERVSEVLNDKRLLTNLSVSDFLTELREMLKFVLAIPENVMKMIIFQNKASVREFSSNIKLFLKKTREQIFLELQLMNIKSLLSKLKVNPVNELVRKVVGCGKQCPFCKAPCEAAGIEHKEHFASLHRPHGLGTYRWSVSQWLWYWEKKTGKSKDEHDQSTGDTSEKLPLSTDTCTTLVKTNASFVNADTKGKEHLYKEYRTHYPDWKIDHMSGIDSLDYWKYIFVTFNEDFAKSYKARAEVPVDWKSITQEQALESLQKVFNESQ